MKRKICPLIVFSISTLISILILLSIVNLLFLPAFAGKDDVLNFDESGSLVMTSTDKKATTATRYKTVGWTMFNASRTKSVVLQFEAFKTDDLGNGYVKSYFKTDADVIFSRIGLIDKSWQKDLYTNGGDLLFDSAMTIIENGNILGGLTDNGNKNWGEIYFTYDGIENARSWQQPDGLLSHFNKRAHLDPHPEMLSGTVIVKHFEMDGRALDQYDYSEFLNNGNSYTYPPTVVLGHEYKGFKVGYDVFPNTALATTGSVEFAYNGTFSIAYVYFYYDVVVNTDMKSSLNADLSGFIKADDRGNEKFDVSKGIPTSENLYVNVFGKNYLFNSSFKENTGSKSYSVTVSKTYNLSWEEDHGYTASWSWTDSEGVTYSNTYWVPVWVSKSDTNTISKTYRSKLQTGFRIQDSGFRI